MNVPIHFLIQIHTTMEENLIIEGRLNAKASCTLRLAKGKYAVEVIFKDKLVGNVPLFTNPENQDKEIQTIDDEGNVEFLEVNYLF